MRCDASRPKETTKVIDIARQHHIAISDKQRNMGIDDISCLRCPAEVPGRPGDPAVQANLGDASKQAGKQRLTRASSSPRLGDAPR
ncbi:MAG: hypothetical protein ACRDYY_14990 [Acidimicrobiales bacterium]